jgi:capsular exopolysaccharide synthesis family protein
MSHIFDALQRSEEENSGAELQAFSEPTELLRRAERRAAAKRESAAVIELPDAATVAERETPRKTESRGLSATSVETALRVEAPSAGDHSGPQASPFSKCQTLSVSLAPRDRLVCLSQESSAAAEAFRLLGVRIRNLRRERQLKKLLITSTIPREGKSTIAANLASTLAMMAKERVLLLEGDVRRPSLSELFGLNNNPGICEWLSGACGPAKAIYHLEGPGFWILPAGKAAGNPLDLLQSARLATVMDELAGWFDWIIIDSPPVLPLADTSVWARMADGVLLVARQGVTEKKQLQRGIDALDPKKLIGALLNSCTAGDSDYYYYGKSPNGSSSDNNIK